MSWLFLESRGYHMHELVKSRKILKVYVMNTRESCCDLHEGVLSQS